MKKESLLLVIGILFGIGFFIVCDGLLTSYEVSKLPPAFKLFGKQGVEMFSTSCTPRILHVYFDGDANSLLFKGQYDEFVAQTNESAEASEFEAKMRQDQLVFAPTCKGSTLVFFLQSARKRH